MSDLTNPILEQAHTAEAHALALARDMLKELEAVRGRIIAKLAEKEAGILKGEFNSEPLTRRIKLLKAQSLEIEVILEEVFSKYRAMVKADGERVFNWTYAATLEALGVAVASKIKKKRTVATSINLWFESSTVDGLLINEWLSKIKGTTRDRIISIGRQAMLQGISPGAAARLMKSEGLQGSKRGLEGVARTFMHSASNYAREDLIRSNQDVLAGVRHSATLDGQTCIACGSLDGRFYTNKENRPALPLHWSCRCNYVPVTKTAYKKKGPGKTITYNQWLNDRLEDKPELVKQILGKTRFELFRNGKLTLNRMVYHGKIRRVNELLND